MKKITMLLLASFFVFSCSNSNNENLNTEEVQPNTSEVQIEEIEVDERGPEGSGPEEPRPEEPGPEYTSPVDSIKTGIDQIEYIVKTGDFSQLNALIEKNPKDYTLILTRAAAKKRIGDIDGSNEDYDFALKNFDLPQADIEIIEAQKNSKEDFFKQYYQDQEQ